MNAALARRQAALAGVALAGALGAIALTHVGDGSSEPPARQAVVEWEEAQVATFAVTAEPTACGVTLAPNAFGVAHPSSRAARSSSSTTRVAAPRPRSSTAARSTRAARST